MNDNLPPGYNGTDSPPTRAVLRCPNAHYWQTIERHEFGITVYDDEVCPHCGEDFGDVTDHDEVPPEDQWEPDDDGE